MDDRKLIVIPAVPSSGTSALAGVLYHLGIQMGQFSLEESASKRGYEMFEDKETALFCSAFEQSPYSMTPKLLGTRCRWRQYINHRLILSEANDLPVGCKLPANLAIQDHDIKSVPVVILNVERPLEDSIRSDLKRLKTSGMSDLEVSLHRLRRTADVSQCWQAREDLIKIVEPELSLTFKELVTNRKKSVENIIVALQNADIGCEFLPTRRQRDQAILFLDKDKKSR